MFKKLFNKKDSLIRDNLILVTASMFGNAAAFFFHLFMIRFLGSADYGTLGVLFSIIYIISAPMLVIQTIITKFTSQYKAKNQLDKINVLLRRSSFKFIKYSSIFFIISLIIIPLLSNFLHIPKTNLFLLAPIIYMATLTPIFRGAFQGLQKFKLLGYNVIIEAFLKLIIGAILVYIGFAINGAVLAILISSLVPILIAYKQLKDYIKKTDKNIDVKEIYHNSYPILIALITLTLFYTIDLFLVKHYFTPIEAGFYATGSLLGKIVYFASLAVMFVMFPKTTELFTLKKSSTNILIKSIIFIIIISAPILLLFFLFPEFVILILGGAEYLPIKNILGLFGLAMTFITLSWALSFYNLSINKYKFVYALVILNILEILAIILYHSTLKEVVIVLNIISLLAILYLGGYTLKNINGKIINNNPSS